MPTYLLIAFWLLIFTATHLPQQSLPSLHFSDKLYHAGAFSGLAFLLAWSLTARRIALRKMTLIVVLICVGYGVVDEWTQQFVAGRTCDIFDLAADCIGALVGLVAFIGWQKYGLPKFDQRIEL